MLYCASDPANTDELLAGLTTLMEGTAPDLRWHALVDLSFDEGRPAWPFSASPVYLYDRGRLAALQCASPVLYELPRQPQALEATLRKLNRYIAGRPMLSFVCIASNAAQCADALRDVLEVETADKQPFLLRMADTRVLETLSRALAPANWARVCKGLQGWHIVNRYGRLEALEMPNTADAAADRSGRLRVSDEELSGLLELGEPDSIINALAEGFPEALPDHPRAFLHAEVCQVCKLARQCGIEGALDRLYLALANRSAGGELWKDARLQEWLRRKGWPKEGFAEALGEFVGIMT
jgi:hypothetical protein